MVAIVGDEDSGSRTSGQPDGSRPLGRQGCRREKGAADEAAIGQMMCLAGAGPAGEPLGALRGADHMAEGVEGERRGAGTRRDGAEERLDDEDVGRDQRAP